ncbi:hypothetical protein CJ178_17890 [Rhodococcus sp. ACPA4]|jgi:hypothetical protein|nr:hypothetical protein CJ178_17890 [Rhodococcus sp. ACPA4]QXW00092.1 hypothetical protein KYT97_16775 [Rhodococcus globerulus]
MAGEKIFVIDRILTERGCGKRFVDAYTTHYVPRAQRRGMTLTNILVSPPLWIEDETNIVTITWTVDGTSGWWKMTRQGRADQESSQWWERHSALTIERSRTMAADAADIEGLSDV